jgi:TPR repeat protein
MSTIEFQSDVGAPGKYAPLYVRIEPDETEIGRFDADAAVRHAQSLAAAGSPAAQFALGHMLLSGQGIARDAEAAYRLFSAAALSGRADAINMVGRCHECGWGVPVDRAEAARWYRAGVEKSHAWAMFNLGSLMLAGDGVARDADGALTLFVRAARRGNAKAMNMIGQHREENAQSRRVLASAMRWYRRAAERGCFRGQYNLARFLAVSGDINGAAHWLRCACAAGPAEFCREIGAQLVAHPEPRLQTIGREALMRSAAA